MNHLPLNPTQELFFLLENVFDEILLLGVKAENGDITSKDYWIQTQTIAAKQINLIHAAQAVSTMLTGSESNSYSL